MATRDEEEKSGTGGEMGERSRLSAWRAGQCVGASDSFGLPCGRHLLRAGLRALQREAERRYMVSGDNTGGDAWLEREL